MTENTDILYKLGELSGKIDAVILSQSAHAEELRRVSLRVSALEQSKAYLYGIAAAVGVVSSTITSLITS